MSENAPATGGSDEGQPDIGIDAQIVHDCLLGLLGKQRDGEGSGRQIFHVQFGGKDLPPEAQGRRLWYCIDRPVVTAGPQILDIATRDNADKPGIKIIRYGTLLVEKFPAFEGLTEEEVAERKGKVVDDELMFELALALTACVAQVKSKSDRSTDTIPPNEFL